MSTYRIVAERVRRKIAGGNPTNDTPVKINEVYVAIAHVLPLLIKQDFYQSYQIGEKYLDAGHYITLRDVVVYDSEPYKHAILPGKPVIVHGRGRPQVNYIGTEDVPFIYKEPGQVSMVKGSEVSQYFTDTHFWYELAQQDCDTTHQLIFDENIPECVSKVNVRYISMPDLDAIDPDAPIPVAATLIQQLVDAVYNYFVPQRGTPEDTKNNNVNDQ